MIKTNKDAFTLADVVQFPLYVLKDILFYIKLLFIVFGCYPLTFFILYLMGYRNENTLFGASFMGWVFGTVFLFYIMDRWVCYKKNNH